MKKVAVIFGTRPEVIKMAPVVWALKKEKDFQTRIINTAQHRTMLDQMLTVLDLEPDVDLDIMGHAEKGLPGLTSAVIQGMAKTLEKEKPDLLLVQGDTTTVFSSALAAFYADVPVGHVEAGLRSGNMRNPFPEEANRKLAGVLASIHFAPTARAKRSLLKENVQEDSIVVAGNTVIDALIKIASEDFDFTQSVLKDFKPEKEPFVLITSHRRESWGEKMHDSFRGILELAKEFPGMRFLFPVHLNPVVRQAAKDIFSGQENVFLTEPLDYLTFVQTMKLTDMVITDSGGIQEEAPAFGIPVMVMRETTERPEAVESGQAVLVGTDTEAIRATGAGILNREKAFDKMRTKASPFGDGKAGQRIALAVSRWLEGERPILETSDEFHGHSL